MARPAPDLVGRLPRWVALGLCVLLVPMAMFAFTGVIMWLRGRCQGKAPATRSTLQANLQARMQHR